MANPYGKDEELLAEFQAFPSPCGVKVVANTKFAMSSQESADVSVPLRGKGCG